VIRQPTHCGQNDAKKKDIIGKSILGDQMHSALKVAHRLLELARANPQAGAPSRRDA
jgi:hypothetical protein